MKTTQEKIEVMQAYADGKQIEIRAGKDWVCCDLPLWNWKVQDYRIKPDQQEPKYRPYKSADEVLEDMKVHGPMLKPNQTGYADESFTILWFGNEGIKTVMNLQLYTDQETSYDVAIWAFKWQDGTPFGRKEE